MLLSVVYSGLLLIGVGGNREVVLVLLVLPGGGIFVGLLPYATVFLLLGESVGGSVTLLWVALERLLCLPGGIGLCNGTMVITVLLLMGELPGFIQRIYAHGLVLGWEGGAVGELLCIF